MKQKINHSSEFFKLLTIALGVLVFILVIVLFSMNFELNKYDNKKVEGKQMEEDNQTSNPIVVFETTKGNFEVELFVDKSPITAGNIKELVEKGFYDNTKFHRVIKDFMIQGGDPLSKNDSLKNRWGTGGSEPIEDEFIRGLSNVRGTLSMANSGPNSGSSQFFINVVDNTYLDWDKAPVQSKHPVFGKVVSGMDIVDEISNVKVGSQDRPVEVITINKAYIKQ